MERIFELLMKLYPPEYRAEFAEEMRSVLLELAGSRRRGFWWRESLGLIIGATVEWSRYGWDLAWTAGSMAAGIFCAGWAQLWLYRYLVSHLAIVCLVAGIARGQEATQDPAAMETARSIYLASFTALREAKTMDDMRKLAVTLSSPGWVSADRFGRTVPSENLSAELGELLALPPERRVTGMDIIWAEIDRERLTVLAWMMPSMTERVDADGAYGPKGETHLVTRGTLIRDLFEKTEAGWRRIRHDKLTPNDTVLAVDNKSRIVPPLDDSRRITFAK